MQLIKEKSYQRDYTKLITKNHLLEDLIKQTEAIFKADQTDQRTRPHKITCKRDKNRYSITVIGTQYRILVTICKDMAVFMRVVNHKTYDRINKNC